MMNRFFLALLTISLVATEAYGNGHGIAYYVLKADYAKSVLSLSAESKQIDDADLESRCLLHGYFIGTCNLYLKTKQFQFRITANPTDLIEGATHEFILDMYSQEAQERVFYCSGFVKIGKSLSAAKDWNKGKFTVLFREIAFKK